MKKLLIAVAVALPASAMAAGENNVGCGWGSKLFDGQSGIAPQVLAATSNNFYGTQTFAITTGTSGCTQDGTVRSNWKTALFIDGNKDKLARDMSVGSGETLDSLAHLLGVQSQDRAAFDRVAKENVSRIFLTDSTADIMANLRDALTSSEQLTRYTAAL